MALFDQSFEIIVLFTSNFWLNIKFDMFFERESLFVFVFSLLIRFSDIDLLY